jgi:hypothetical protein
VQALAPLTQAAAVQLTSGQTYGFLLLRQRHHEPGNDRIHFGLCLAISLVDKGVGTDWFIGVEPAPLSGALR